MNINKRVGRALKLLIVCVCLQGVVRGSGSLIVVVTGGNFAVRATQAEPEASKVVDAA
jgi:hypothetical protein